MYRGGKLGVGKSREEVSWGGAKKAWCTANVERR